MPVLAEHPNPSMGAGGRQAPTSTPTNTTYLFISLAFLITLGIAISRRRRNSCTSKSNNDFNCKRKNSNAAWVVTMQSPTPPTSASSALPEKPYLPNADVMDHQDTDAQQDFEEPQQPFYSPQLQQGQHFPSQDNTRDVIVQAKVVAQHHQPPPPFHTRLGSLPAVTTSLLHPELPSPTIAVAPMKIQTHGQPLMQNSYLPGPFPHQNQNQSQSQSYIQNQPPSPLVPQSQFQPPLSTPGAYTQNEILFVPSPTEYTSFEALYSKFPPPIYHGPNPASYASTTFSEESTSSGSVPRRRSYIKTLSNGSEMSGEVVESAGQWRRHTRVFGGGVCVACEESESRRMSA